MSYLAEHPDTSIPSALLAALFIIGISLWGAGLFLSWRKRSKPVLRELCLGCHEVRLATDMGFDGSLYRCKWCLNPTLDDQPRDRPSQTQHAGRGSTSVQAGGSVSVTNAGGTGYSTEVIDVAAGKTLRITGTGAQIHIKGEVGPRARVICEGTGARIRIDGFIGSNAQVRAVGTGASVTYLVADSTADITAEGTGAKVRKR